MGAVFDGFPKEMPQFLHELKANNEKAWFDENRADFVRLCVDPCFSFIRSVGEEMGSFDPPHKADARTNGSLRRIFRDTRFSADKTPYHAYLHLIFWCGEHANRSPGLHLVFSAGGLGIGAGQWAFATDELSRYRMAVCDEARLASLKAALIAAKTANCHLESPSLKKPPKGFTASEDNQMFLRQNGIVVRNRNEDYPDGFFDDRGRTMLLERLAKLLPLQKWLMENVHAAY